MRTNFKIWYGIPLVLAMLACGPLSQVHLPAGEGSERETPSASLTVPVPTLPGTTVPNTAGPESTFLPTPMDAGLPSPTPAVEPTITPDITFDQQANAYRIRFAPNGTWVQFSDTISAGTPKRYVLTALKGQIMSVSIVQGPVCTVEVNRKDGKPIGNSPGNFPFWRDTLPASQDYIVTVGSQANTTCTLRIVIAPPGEAMQMFGFSDPRYPVGLSYSDEFAPTDVQIPVNPKGTPLLTLAFIDPTFYSPRTNLSEAYLLLAASMDPAVVATCTQPATDIPETSTGTVKIGDYPFTRSEFSGAAAGNRYDQVAYRTVWEGKCFEMIVLIHSTNIGNYAPGTVVEYDQVALMSKFEAVLNTFRAR
jgi:hypothetical protein